MLPYIKQSRSVARLGSNQRPLASASGLHVLEYGEGVASGSRTGSSALASASRSRLRPDKRRPQRIDGFHAPAPAGPTVGERREEERAEEQVDRALDVDRAAELAL